MYLTNKPYPIDYFHSMHKASRAFEESQTSKRRRLLNVSFK